jgi:hypothetical protein
MMVYRGVWVMAEKTQGGYRERIFFTDPAWARVESMSERFGLDERTFIRMCVGLQLAQFETTLGAAQSSRITSAVHEEMTERVESFFEGQPLPEPSVAARKRMVEKS